jgi:1,4-dihydroxy-2-naphthoate polyprenyltransferase
MASPAQWLEGARPRTLPAAIAPVIAGSGVAAAENSFIFWRALAALALSAALQIGVNYANDYSDGIRGTDAVRAGPLRLVGSGVASPTAVRTAAFVAFGVGAAFGLLLAAVSSWWLIPVGAASIAAAWLYTGGPKPYGYIGLGELFVFVFFGLVAVCGTAFVQVGSVTGLSVLVAVPIGLIACAILIANNLRDIPSDKVSGKQTLAVRIGDPATRILYAAAVGAPFVLALVVALVQRSWWCLLPLAAIPVGARPIRVVQGGAVGRDLIAVLKSTALLEIAFSVLLAIGLALS